MTEFWQHFVQRMHKLPPGFLAIMGLLVLVLWFLDERQDQRAKIVGELLKICIERK